MGTPDTMKIEPFYGPQVRGPVETRPPWQGDGPFVERAFSPRSADEWRGEKPQPTRQRGRLRYLSTALPFLES